MHEYTNTLLIQHADEYMLTQACKRLHYHVMDESDLRRSQVERPNRLARTRTQYIVVVCKVCVA